MTVVKIPHEQPALLSELELHYRSFSIGKNAGSLAPIAHRANWRPFVLHLEMSRHPLLVRIGLPVVDGLQQAALSTPGPMACGLLLGRAAGPALTVIQDFKPLPTLDPASLETAIAEVAPRVVGFYRTAPDGSLRLTGDNIALADKFFNHPNSVALLIDSGPAPPPNAVFFFRERGKMNCDVPLLEFPLDARQLGLAEWRYDANALGISMPGEQTGEPGSRWARHVRSFWAGAAATVAGGAVFYLVLSQRQLIPTTPSRAAAHRAAGSGAYSKDLGPRAGGRTARHLFPTYLERQYARRYE